MRPLFLIAVACTLWSGCSGPMTSNREGFSLSIKGSDSMLPLLERLAEEYMRRHPGMSIAVEGGGSAIGIQALIDDEADICATSRPFTADEVRQLAARYSSLGVSLPVAKDALAIIVHPSNPIRSMSMSDVRRIFTGDYTRWSEVGGDDRPITVIRREENSGSHLYIEEHLLLGKPFSSRSVHISGPKGVIHSVLSDSSAIAYSTVSYVQKVKVVPLDGIALTPETVRSGAYPVTRYLYFYVIHPPEGAIKRFFDWVIGVEGQAVVRQNGYVPLLQFDE